MREVRPRGERQALAAVGVVVGARLDDRAGLGVAGHLQIGEAKMMGPAVDAFNDRVGRPLQLVVQPTLDQPAEHRIGWLIAMQGEAG